MFDYYSFRLRLSGPSRFAFWAFCQLAMIQAKASRAIAKASRGSVAEFAPQGPKPPSMPPPGWLAPSSAPKAVDAVPKARPLMVVAATAPDDRNGYLDWDYIDACQQRRGLCIYYGTFNQAICCICAPSPLTSLTCY